MATVTWPTPQVRIGDLVCNRAGFHPGVAMTAKYASHDGVEARRVVARQTFGDSCVSGAA